MHRALVRSSLFGWRELLVIAAVVLGFFILMRLIGLLLSMVMHRRVPFLGGTGFVRELAVPDPVRRPAWRPETSRHGVTVAPGQEVAMADEREHWEDEPHTGVTTPELGSAGALDTQLLGHLRRLTALRDAGLISDVEFEAQRTQSLAASATAYRLMELNLLEAAGLITAEERAAKRAELLADL